MKLKLDAEGHVVLVDGMPVYTHADGKDIPFDAPAAAAKIHTLNGEAQGHREKFEAAEKKLKAFDGIEDAEAARKALNTVANIDASKLIAADKVEEIRVQAIKTSEAKWADREKQLTEQLKTSTASVDQLTGQIADANIGGSFARSKFIADKTAIPADLLQAQFGRAFKFEDGKVVGYNGGSKIFSRQKPGEVADFEEAIEILIDAYPNKDHILKGRVGAGGGAGQGGGGGGGDKKIARASFDQLSASEKAATAKAGIQVVD